MVRLTLSFLNTFQVTFNQQPVTHFRSANNQGLLVYLALCGNRPISREVLAALFWPHDSEQNARNNLRQSLYQLRKLLGDLDDPARPFLQVTRQTVQVNSAGDYALDVDEFIKAVDKGDLATAVSLYQGDLLPGFTCDSLEFEYWLRQEREQLHNLALETMFEVTQEALGNGRYVAAQAMAHQQLALEPWREQAHRQLMLAYALAGDRGKAVNQFAQCQAVLSDELNVEPARETVALFDDIKAGRLASVATGNPIRPPLKARHNLPTYTTALVGRDIEIVQIGQMIAHHRQRLVSIIGPGGMGKTRLGIAVGYALLDHYPEGVYFVDLAPLAQPEEIGLAIAATLDYQAPDKSAALFPQLLNALQRRKLLIILDNFEHLLAGATLVSELLQACPHVTILVTSRQRLNLTDESRFVLGGLSIPANPKLEDALDFTAVQLFVENGRRIQPDFALHEDNAGDIVRICRLVQGMPLGLMLAATWLEMLSPAEIAAEVENSLAFLAADLADVPVRQRSMQAVFAYSWQQMTSQEQSVLAKLSVFRGGFTREAAVAVANASLRVLLGLVSKSLLQRDVDDGRFAIHELLRQYAADQRQQIDPDNEALFGHCRYFSELTRLTTGQTLYYLPIMLPQKYAADRDNFGRAWTCALEYGRVDELTNLVRGIAMFSLRQGASRPQVPAPAIRALRQHGYPEDGRAMLELKLLAQTMRIGFDDPYDIRNQLLNLETVLRGQPHPDLLVELYRGLADIALTTDGSERLEIARHWIQKAYEVAVETEQAILIKSMSFFLLGYNTLTGRADETSAARLEEFRQFFAHNYPDSVVHYHVLHALHRYHEENRSFEQAIWYANQHVHIATSWQDLWWISNSLRLLAGTYAHMGLPRQALAQLLDILEWHLSIGQEWQSLGFLWSIVLDFPQYVSDWDTAVTILSIVYHHPENHAFGKRRIDEALPQLRNDLGTDRFETAWEKGSTGDFDTAVALMRSMLTSGVEDDA